MKTQKQKKNTRSVILKCTVTYIHQWYPKDSECLKKWKSFTLLNTVFRLAHLPFWYFTDQSDFYFFSKLASMSFSPYKTFLIFLLVLEIKLRASCMLSWVFYVWITRSSVFSWVFKSKSGAQRYNNWKCKWVLEST